MERTPRQQDIIDVAIKIIANYGLQNLSIRHIAKEVGIHESTIYSHFKSKDEILECVLDYYMESASAWTKEFDLNGTSILNKIELYFKKHSLQFNVAPDRAKVYWLALLNSEGNAFDRVLNIHLSFRNWLRKTIEEGQRNGEITDNFTSENLSAIISGTIYLNCRRLAFDHAYNIEKNTSETWKMIETLFSTNK